MAGVDGLKSFMEKYCTEACYPVSISALVSDHKTNKSSDRAEIVVTAHDFFSMWSEGVDWTIGIEVRKLIERLRSFVTNFQNIGADLVFFFPGLTEKRRNTWYSSETEDMKTMKKKANFMAFVLRYVLNCKVHFSIDKCNGDIIQYVTDNDCVAIFSSDTNFIVSKVNCFMLSACDFDPFNMTTKLYNRNKLCIYLNFEFKKEFLPLFGVLAGNDDTSDLDTLCFFHPKLFEDYYRGNKRLFSRLAEFIIDHYSVEGVEVYSPDTDITSPITERFGWKVLRNDDDEEFNLSYKSYFPKSELPPPDSPAPKDAWSQVLSVAEERLRNVLLPASVWAVLSKRMYESVPHLEKLEGPSDGNGDPRELPSVTITRPLRQRLYGILFHEIQNTKPTVEEWRTEYKSSYEKPLVVQPEYIQANHPGLIALWDENQASVHKEKKWILFLKAISSNKPIRNVGAWMDLPSDLVVSTAACYYLFMERQFLNESELRIVLATVALYPAFTCETLEPLYDGKCDPRAVKISQTFDDTFNDVFCVLASCGYPVPLSKDTAHTTFEPRLFQQLYKRVKNEPDYPPLYGHGDCIGRFNQMYDTIHG